MLRVGEKNCLSDSLWSKRSFQAFLCSPVVWPFKSWVVSRDATVQNFGGFVCYNHSKLVISGGMPLKRWVVSCGTTIQNFGDFRWCGS